MRAAPLAFALPGPAAVRAFWPPYLKRLADVDLPVHAHAVAMTAWLALLAVFVAARLPTFFLDRTEAWRAFAQAFAAR